MSDTTLGDVIEYNARYFDSSPAIKCDDKTITHGELARRARRLASALARSGVRHQDRIAVLATNRPEYFEVYAAAELAGLVTATVNFRLASPEIAYVLTDSAPAAFFFELQYAPIVEELKPLLSGVRLVCFDGAIAGARSYDELLAAGDEAGPPYRAHPDDVAHLIYTSGTTGRPKGCMLGHRGSVWKSRMHGVDMGILQTDRMLLTMPIFHLGAKSMQLATHWRAGCVVLHSSFDPKRVIETIECEHITLAHLAPSMIQSILQRPEINQHDLSSIRLILYSAAPMPSPVLRKGIEVLGKVFHQIYGQTEGIISVLLRHQHELDGPPAARLVSVGQPIPEVQVKIVGDDGMECPPGEPGEIVYRGGSTFIGYWNNSVATAEVLRDGWCHSGDIGRFDEDQFLYIVDRKKDMIISGGENIYSREVEECIVSHPSVTDVAVISIPDDKWGEAVCAVVVTRDGATLTEAGVIEHCRSRIASYKKPKHVRFVSSLPRLVSGKINKRELREQFIGLSADPTSGTGSPA